MALSTDIILGFPGETESDFRMSMALMEEVRPDIINVTRFSARPGTAAHDMGPKVPGWKAKDWSRELTELRFRLTAANYSEMIGQTHRALATERRKPGTTFLRTMGYRPVVARCDIPLAEWHDIAITGKEKTHLSGKVVKN
jgi:tRNA A37 methylthiotransferase MiaB